MATAPKRPPKLTAKQAARKITDLVFEHLEQFSEEEQNRRIDSFCERVDKLTASHAKPAKSQRSSAKSR
ncbi:MAG: hypothetical protein LAN64_07370 [Acidobacteriia bacterium]|nr:hypothetical protein [Terriglobia bacterium]